MYIAILMNEIMLFVNVIRDYNVLKVVLLIKFF